VIDERRGVDGSDARGFEQSTTNRGDGSSLYPCRPTHGSSFVVVGRRI